MMDQGLPEEDHSSSAVSVDGVKLVEAQADQSAIVLCQQALPDIASHPHWTRMSNLPAVLKAMSKHGSLPTTIVDAAETVDSYITDLASSIAALKKETPGTLTDENKELVRHLKTRKVTLYSDTLKTLRAMGFSRNLGTNLLEKQSSTAVVLVGSGVVPHVDGVVLSAIEYFYHKTLDLAPRFRHATYEHSDDLNREVVQRSIGYLEGVLHVMFRQRQFLARAAGDERGLHGAVETIKDLSVGGDESFRPQARSANHAQVVRWLVQILKAGIHLVEVHGKLGGADNAGVRGSLVGWAETFAKLDAAHDRLPRLPDGFSSSGGDKLQGDVERELDALRVGLAEIAQARPDLAFVVRQIQLWTSIQATEVINGISGDDIDNFAAAALTLSSKILVALQNFQKVAQTLPVTTEDAGWFLNYSDNLQKSVDALRMAKITSEVKSLIHQLKSLPADQSPTASALLRLIHPVLSQYSTICTQNLTQFASLHRTTSRLGYHLAASFVQISSQGFCTPEEKSDEKSGESGNVESGTGLGDGEGAEDISKDIKADEDLSDLAQDPNNKTQGDIEENQDAVDMGDDELEGEMGSVAGEDEDEEKKDGDKDGEDEEEDEMDEQAGDVDDLDPTAVDEKMWDGSGEEEAEKDQMGDQEKGKKDDDQSAAAEGEKKEQQKGEEQEDGNAPPDEVGEEQGDEDAEMEAGQEEEGVAQEELNRQDQNVQENETLALPEDMDIEIDDGEEESGDDDDLDGLSDAEKPEEKQADAPDDMSQSGDEEKGEEEHQKDEDVAEEEAEQEEEIDAAGDREEEMEVDAEEEGQGEEGQDEEKDEKKPPLPDDGTGADQDDVAPSDVQNGGGQAEDANMQDDEVENKAGQKEQGALGKQSAEEDKAPGSKGALSSMDQEQGPSDETEDADSKDAQPFKKLGDALDRWYRNQREIQAASDSQEKTEQSAEDMARAEFQHLQDETAEADTQALGTATNEEARPMDDAMAVDTEMDEGNNQIMPEDEQEEEGGDVEMEDIEPAEPQDASKNDREEGRSGVATRKGAYETDDKDEIPQAEAPEDVDDEEIDDTSSQLLATHITEEDEDATPLRDYTEALDMWSGFQTKTQALSQSLSSQLRLILTPTQSTKLSGSFRTGKRLNIKKIIPYIASSYKRDKIWMRRAIPSKRAYQILLCVDDSSSMSDDNRSSSGNLALESLVMVTRALTVLEAGQIGVLGFGTDVFVAHALTDPSFTSQDTGAHVLQKFTFRQEGTDMVRLLRKTIDHFREARVMQASGAGSEDLWQLALILSDGLVQSRDHARLRPLLREAMEQRVMVVFIVMDDARENKKGHSVLELKEARFGPDGVPVIHRYLDSFPFPYYLIVHHLEDLPGALAALLRTWFAEVNS
jgi:midasin